MGGRGGFASGPGLSGEGFASVVIDSAASHDFVLNALQRFILEGASERDVITQDDSVSILDDTDLEYDFILDTLDDVMSPNLKRHRTSKYVSKSSSGKLRDAISFWKWHTYGKVPADAKAVLDRSDIKAKYLTGDQQLSTEEIKALCDQLGKFGEWLMLAYAAEVLGNDPPKNVKDYE